MLHCLFNKQINHLQDCLYLNKQLTKYSAIKLVKLTLIQIFSKHPYIIVNCCPRCVDCISEKIFTRRASWTDIESFTCWSLRINLYKYKLTLGAQALNQANYIQMAPLSWIDMSIFSFVFDILPFANL